MIAPEEIGVTVASTGVSHAFGILGSGPSLRLATALDDAGVSFHTTTSEAAAAIMAGTVGRLAGTAGICTSIKGPGFANLLSGVSGCHLDELPVVAFCEAHPSGAGIGSHKFLDQRALARPVTKAQGSVSGTERDVRRLLACTTEEIPGPALFELAPTGTNEFRASSDGFTGVSGAMRRVENAKRPLVIVGALASRRPWRTELERLPLPIMTTAAAKGSLDERLPQVAGVFTGVGGPLAPESTLVKDCDLIVGIGLRQRELLAGPSRPVANFDEIAAPPLPSWDVETAPASALSALWPLLSGRGWGLDLVAQCLGTLSHHLGAMPQLLPQHVVAILAQSFDDIRLVVDTGSFCTIAEHEWRATGPGRYLGSGIGRNMGIGLPMAIGVSLQTASSTVLVTGDGGLPMYVGELQTAAELRLPLMVLLMNDRGYGSVRRSAVEARLPTAHLEFPGRSWVAAAEGMGFAATVVEDEDKLYEAFRWWRQEGGPMFVEVRCDPDSYLTMTDGLR